MWLRTLLLVVNIHVLTLSTGCSYKFCDIGPVCRAEHLFLPQPVTIETTLSDEELALQPLSTSFEFATIEFAGRIITLELERSDSFTHPDVGRYVFTPRARFQDIKFANVLMTPVQEFPHDQVPAPHTVRLCLTKTSYVVHASVLKIGDTPFSDQNGKWCITFPADKLGARVDCGDGCPPDKTIP
jgi:hypothetical protein